MDGDMIEMMRVGSKLNIMWNESGNKIIKLTIITIRFLHMITRTKLNLCQDLCGI